MTQEVVDAVKNHKSKYFPNNGALLESEFNDLGQDEILVYHEWY